MPHIRIRGLSDSAVRELSAVLPEELAKTLNTSEDNFTVEKIATDFFRAGRQLKDDEADPMIEFLWFDRGDEIRQAAAEKVTELVKKHTRSEYVAVVFIALPKSHYFENGSHF